MNCSFCDHECRACGGDAVVTEHNVAGMEITVRCTQCADAEWLVDVFDGPCATCFDDMGCSRVRDWRGRFDEHRRTQQAQARALVAGDSFPF